MVGSKSTDTPMDPNMNMAKSVQSLRIKISLLKKSIYLTITRPDITFATCASSQYMQDPKMIQWEVLCKIVRYLK